MEYENIVWSVGDEVTAEKLNHMGRGIANATPGDKILVPLQMVTIDGNTGPDGAEIEHDEEELIVYTEKYGDVS